MERISNASSHAFPNKRPFPWASDGVPTPPPGRGAFSAQVPTLHSKRATEAARPSAWPRQRRPQQLSREAERGRGVANFEATEAQAEELRKEEWGFRAKRAGPEALGIPHPSRSLRPKKTLSRSARPHGTGPSQDLRLSAPLWAQGRPTAGSEAPALSPSPSPRNVRLCASGVSTTLSPSGRQNRQPEPAPAPRGQLRFGWPEAGTANHTAFARVCPMTRPRGARVSEPSKGCGASCLELSAPVGVSLARYWK